MTRKIDRNFEDTLAKREKVPLLIGLVGPSSGGKTVSALELAHGIQLVNGGDIGAIDTESKRMLHYADMPSFSDKSKTFKFKHLPFGTPFSPLDYLAAIEHFYKKGIKTIIIDSMSHEHDGAGGVLEMHESELDRIAGNDWDKRNRASMLAWAKPKAERRQLINAILQYDVNFIFCFRAKEKVKMIPGRPPETRGWQPIAGEEFVFEMTLNCLLPPGVNGVPEWEPEEKAERQMIKLPAQFKNILTPGKPLSIDIGRQLALWAEGTKPVNKPIEKTIDLSKANEVFGEKPTDKCDDRIEVMRELMDIRAKYDEKLPITGKKLIDDYAKDNNITLEKIKELITRSKDSLKLRGIEL